MDMTDDYAGFRVVADYALLKRRIERLSKELDDATAIAATTEQRVLDYMVDKGLQQLKFATPDANGGQMLETTIYIQKRVFAGLADGAMRSDAVDAVEAFEPGLVKRDFNWNTLSAYMRERVADQDPLLPADAAVPEELKQYITVNTSRSARVKFAN